MPDRDVAPTIGGTAMVIVPARVYWEGQLFTARTPEGVSETLCRGPEPIRAIEALRQHVASRLRVPAARVHFALSEWPKGYDPPTGDRRRGDPKGLEPRPLSEAWIAGLLRDWIGACGYITVDSMALAAADLWPRLRDAGAPGRVYERHVESALKMCIAAHGTITPKWTGSAAKRIRTVMAQLGPLP